MSQTKPIDPEEQQKIAPEANKPKRNWLVLWLLIPASAILLVVLGLPIVKMVIWSFQGVTLGDMNAGTEEWNNFENYKKIFGDQQFWDVLWRTVIFTVVCVALTMAFGTLLALLLVRLKGGMRIVVMIGMMLAWATPVVTATQVWQFIFDSEMGLVNYFLTAIGLEQFEGYSWLSDPTSFLALAVVIVVWGAIPFVALSIYAGLTQIPAEYYEAASIDGANSPSQFRHITLPVLAPIFLILAALSTIWDFRVFTQIFILQKSGGISSETDLLSVFAYRTSFSASDFGAGSAIGVIMVLILAIFSIYYVRQMIKQLEEE